MSGTETTSGLVSGVIEAGTPLPFASGFANVADFNEDGWLEPFGFLNNGDGTFSDSPVAGIQAILANYAGRIDRDVRIFDIDGDGHLDALWNVYSDPSVENSFTLVLHGDGTGGFSRVEEWRDVRGYGETIVSADFNNDGLTDVFIPVYTHVDGSDSNYLFFNQGSGVFGDNVAQEWGVGLSFLPAMLRVEGAQGADVNFDGKIDLFVGSHMFINEGDSFSAHPLDTLTFDEGSSLFDYDNDGDFDLVLRGENLGPRLYESVDGHFIDRGTLTGTETILGFGINVADLDGNGWQDIIVGGEGCISIFFNFEGTFTRYYAAFTVGDVPATTVTFGEAPCCGICQHGGPGVCEALAVADFNHDGKLDIVSKAGTLVHFVNNLDIGHVLSLTVLSATGVEDQFGRTVRLTSLDDPSIVMARAVESGSGYLSQSQYEMLIGLPVDGAYSVEVIFANGPYRFTAAAGQEISAFADGRVSIVGSASADTMGGGYGADHLGGEAGDDRILGSAGADTIDGGDGTDTLDYSAITSGVTADLSNGTASVQSVVQNISHIENLIGTAFADTLTGDSGVNVLVGGAGADILDGGGGADSLSGGLGDDTYLVDSAADTVIEGVGEGTDEIRTTAAIFSLPDNVELLTGLLDTGQTLTGNALGNTFSGGAGADTFIGGLGNDRYFVGLGDNVVEAAGEGSDEVLTDLAVYTLTANVELLTGTSSAGQVLTGNDRDNRLAGGSGADTFAGGLGNDIYLVGLGDTVIEAAGEGTDEVRTALTTFVLFDHVERLTGIAAVSQHLYGNSGANEISGGTAADIFEGGAGDDVYIVGLGDLVVEQGSEGTDEVRTALQTYTLTANVENLTGIAVGGQKLVGNELNNVIRANSSLNTLIGRGGDDTYWISNSQTSISEKPNEGLDTIRTSVSFFLQAGVSVEVLAAADENATTPLSLTGNEFANTIIGGAGNDVIEGRGGLDTLVGNQGNDTYIIDNLGVTVVEADGGGANDIILTSVDFVLAEGVYVENLSTRSWGATTPINLTGNSLANVIIGNAGDNVLTGGGGADIMQGFGGNDRYYVDNASTQIIEGANEGTNDIVLTSVSYVLPEGVYVESLSARDWAATTPINITGNSFGNLMIVGNAGNNVLDGGAGADTMQGREGNDTYIVDSASDQVIEDAGQGTDTVRAKNSYALAPGVSVEVLAAWDPLATAALVLTGNEFANTVIGGAGDDQLDGGAGNDILQGFGGNDVYIVDSVLDSVIEAAGQGTDTVRTKVGYTLAAGTSIEVLAAWDPLATTALTLTGNEFANTLIGNAGVNSFFSGGGTDTFSGLGGNDRYYIDNSAIQLIEGADDGASDILLTSVNYVLAEEVYIENLSARDWNATTALSITGNALANTIVGNAGDNVLDGGGGADVLQGLTGNDIYIVDNLLDRVLEVAGQGTDTIRTKISYMLAAGLSVEVMAAWDPLATTALTLTGNELANTLIGNAGVNMFFSGGGADTFSGLGGNDRYYIDNSAIQLIEGAGDGASDILLTSVNYVLAEGVYIENLSARDWNATTALSITGNSLANVIVGNAGDNIITGGGGADVLQGLGGNDRYYITDSAATIIEGASEGANDILLTSVSYVLADGVYVENLSSRDWNATTALNITGNWIANVIVGNDGSNVLDGRGGADRLEGRGGADTFAFTTALGGGNVDVIADFVSGTDHIALKASVFSGLSGAGIAASAFVVGDHALDADDRIIYNPTTGGLFFDSDGSGAAAAIQFARLSGMPEVLHSDFLVI